MQTTTADTNRNGHPVLNQDGPQESGLEPRTGSRSLGSPTAHVALLGAGQTHPVQFGAVRPPHDLGQDIRNATGEPAFSAFFEALLTEHEAEAEYQGYLAEVEAEHLSRLEEEAASPLFAFLSRYAGEGVAA